MKAERSGKGENEVLPKTRPSRTLFYLKIG